MKEKDGQKSLPDSFTFNDKVEKILKLLDAGNYPAKIARILGMSKQHVYYYTKKLLRHGYIEKTVRDRITFYHLTQKGKNLLVKMESRFKPCRFVRLHNVVVKFPILEEPKIEIDWRKVELQNWSQLVGRELGLTVRKNPRSIEVFCDSLEGDDPYQLLLYAFDEANRLAEHLEQKFGMKLGRPCLSRKPHFAIKDVVAEHLGKFMEFSDDIGKMDESEGYGELDLYDPNFVKNYLITFTSLPSQVQKQKKDLEDIKEILVELSEISAKQTETLETFRVAMQQHLALIHELRETTNALREAVEELRRVRHKPRRTKSKEKPKPKPKPRGLFGKLSEWWKQGYQE